MIGRLSRIASLASGAVTDPQVRHYLSARQHAWRLASQWRRQIAAWHRDAPDRPVVGIALVEHLGDIIAAEPIVRALREQYPDGRLVWVVSEKFTSLVEHHPELDAVWPVRCLTEWSVISRDSPFDVTVDLHVPGRCCVKCRHTHRKADMDQGGIDIGNYYSHGCLLEVFCQTADVPVINRTPRLYLPDHVVAEVDSLDLPERFVAIHCQSNQAERDWSAPRWQAFVEQLVSHDVNVVEVGLEPVVELDDRRYRSLCGELSLLQTAEVIGRAAVFVGIDSGPAHMGNAMGTPGVILLGKYQQYTQYLPYSGFYGSPQGATIVRAAGPVRTLEVEPAVAAVLERLDGGTPAAVGAAAGAEPNTKDTP